MKGTNLRQFHTCVTKRVDAPQPSSSNFVTLSYPGEGLFIVKRNFRYSYIFFKFIPQKFPQKPGKAEREKYAFITQDLLLWFRFYVFLTVKRKLKIRHVTRPMLCLTLETTHTSKTCAHPASILEEPPERFFKSHFSATYRENSHPRWFRDKYGHN